jgi:hypothetical protein
MVVSVVDTGVGLAGGPITSTGTIYLVPPTGSDIGGVRAGNGVLIGVDGSITLATATALSTGVVQAGSGLHVNSSGILSTINNGTVLSVTPGPGLGAPATGNAITTSGTIRLLPPTTNGLELGGVKAGNNVTIAVDGTISATGVLQTNNPYAYNSYIFPVAAVPSAAPGTNGQLLTLIDRVTGEVGWTNSGTLTTVVGTGGVTVVSTPTTATVSLATVPTILPATYGATGLIPTITVNNLGQVTSAGQANAYPPYQNATVTAPPNLILDFADNNTNWEWTLQANTVMMAPVNAETGQSGAILLRQNSVAPFALTWDAVWKWPDFTPVGITPTLSAVDMALFTVVSPTYIVIYRYITNIG